MPVFEYRGLTPAGKQVKGLLEADSTPVAAPAAEALGRLLDWSLRARGERSRRPDAERRRRHCRAQGPRAARTSSCAAGWCRGGSPPTTWRSSPASSRTPAPRRGDADRGADRAGGPDGEGAAEAHRLRREESGERGQLAGRRARPSTGASSATSTVNMVRAGEASGALDAVLARLRGLHRGSGQAAPEGGRDA